MLSWIFACVFFGLSSELSLDGLDSVYQIFASVELLLSQLFSSHTYIHTLVRKNVCVSPQFTPEKNCITSVQPSTPIKLHSNQLQSDISTSTKQLATRTIQLENNANTENFLTHIPLFEEFTTTVSDLEKKHQEYKATELDQPTQNLGGKLTPRFSSESLLNFMHEFETQQEISKMLQGTAYEEALTDREIEK